MSKKPSAKALGMTQVNITVPAKLHEDMKAIWVARMELECDVIKLSRMYREAGEQYVAAKPQQNLLKKRAANGTSKKGRVVQG